MDERQVERLLRRYAARVPAERLFAEERAGQIWAEVLSTAEAPAEIPHQPFRLLRVVSRHWWVFGTAAAIVLVAVITGAFVWNARGLRLAVDGAYAKSELFRVTRAGHAPASAPDDLFFIGVRVDRAAYLRVFTVDNLSRLEPLALDRAGAHELHIPAKTELALGGYRLSLTDAEGVSTRITHFLILATLRSVDEAAVTRWLETAQRPSADVAQLARELRRNFGGAASVVTP